MITITKFFSFTFIILFLCITIFFSSIVSFITDWWWYQQVGFTEIFITSLSAKIVVGFTTGLFAAAFLIGNLVYAIGSKTPWMVSIPAAVLGINQPVSLTNKTIKKISITISLILAFFIGLIATSSWHAMLTFLSNVSFNQRDPIFGKDVSFYVFSLPIFSFFLGLIKMLIFISLVMCGLIYILRGNLHLSRIFSLFDISKFLRQTDKNHIGESTTNGRLHIGILLSLFLATIACSTYLSLFHLLTNQRGPVFGAAFTDVTIMVPILWISVFVYVGAAILALFYATTGKTAPLFTAILLAVVVNISSSIIPSVFQKLIVAPNELTKETPFIKHNIALSRKAYGLDNVEQREIAADKPITAKDIAANNLTIKNVRLWDRMPLLSTFSQIQEIRTYYEFTSIDNDRYTINNELRQIMLSPRELASESLPNKNWINERLTFTHGYGVAAGPVNQVTPEGLPVLFVKDLPPHSQVKELAIKRPEVYFGEIPNDYVIVNTKSKEFDYPKGDENVYTTYRGNDGVSLNSLLKRLFYSLRFGSLKLLLSSDITSQSKIIYYRNIQQRVSKIAPFLTYDHDPYLVIAEGKLYWILDAYTTTDQYPYSQMVSLHGEELNYIRNSVKVVVDAYEGDITFYQTDINDPLIKTYSKIFPKTFLPFSKMPKSLLTHLRYPEDIFSLQTTIYTTYHMDDPQIFYNKEDQWEIPAIASGEETHIMDPRHMIMKLPGEESEEYILMLPFTPRAKDNLSAWMVARNDGKHYGKLVVYRFPKDKLIFGPKQIIGRISQDDKISQQISLWDQGGSQVIQGPLLVIPIEESLVYVRPLYLKAATGKIPELKRVIVAYENKIAMEATLEEGLAKIFGSDNNPQPSDSSPAKINDTPLLNATNEDLLKEATQAYQSAIGAQREGNWEKYGEEIKRLGDILNQLRQ